MLKNILLPNFAGTISRRTYWLSILAITIISSVVVLLLIDKESHLSLVFAFMYDRTGGFVMLPVMALMPLAGTVFLFFITGAFSDPLPELIAYLWVFYSALLLLGLQVRRLRDRGKSVLYTLLPFIPIPIVNLIGLSYLIYLLSSKRKDTEKNN